VAKAVLNEVEDGKSSARVEDVVVEAGAEVVDDAECAP
jgi:hypothetical protein